MNSGEDWDRFSDTSSNDGGFSAAVNAVRIEDIEHEMYRWACEFQSMANAMGPQSRRIRHGYGLAYLLLVLCTLGFNIAMFVIVYRTAVIDVLLPAILFSLQLLLVTGLVLLFWFNPTRRACIFESTANLCRILHDMTNAQKQLIARQPIAISYAVYRTVGRIIQYQLLRMPLVDHRLVRQVIGGILRGRNVPQTPTPTAMSPLSAATPVTAVGVYGTVGPVWQVGPVGSVGFVGTAGQVGSAGNAGSAGTIPTASQTAAGTKKNTLVDDKIDRATSEMWCDVLTECQRMRNINDDVPLSPPTYQTPLSTTPPFVPESYGATADTVGAYSNTTDLYRNARREHGGMRRSLSEPSLVE
jgi:hypothetical protein